MATQPNLSRLKSQLGAAKVREQDTPLYQVIIQLIDAVRQLQLATTESIGGVSGGVINLSNLDLLTHSDESIELPNSRQLIAGTNITFDDTVINQRILNVPDAVDREWSVLSDGDLDEPELVFANGEVIMTHIP